MDKRQEKMLREIHDNTERTKDAVETVSTLATLCVAGAVTLFMIKHMVKVIVIE